MNERQAELTAALDLVKRMGARSFDPIPPDQHAWSKAEEHPPLFRFWGWMCEHTIHWGHRCEYAVDDVTHKRALRIEDAAHDLGMDEANARSVWRDGVRRGLWRNGTSSEGERRLYLCGEVKPTGEVEDKGEEKATGKVCANLFPPYILKQIKELAPEQQDEFWEETQTDVAIENQLRADFDAARRAMFTQRQDTRFSRFQIKKIREEHKPRNGQDADERKERIQLLLPLVTPVFERYAQTFLESAHTPEKSLREAENGSAQSLEAGLPLLPSETEKSQKKSSKHNSAAGEVASPPERISGKAKSSYPRSNPEVAGGSGAEASPKTQPPTPEPDVKPDANLQSAMTDLVLNLKEMQKAYSRTDFGLAVFNPDTKPGQLLLIRVLEAIGGPACLPEFYSYVLSQFKGLDRGAMAKLQGRPPGSPAGPRGLGLILKWAGDFGKARASELGRGAGS